MRLLPRQAAAVLPVLEELATRQSGVFTVGQARAVGYTDEEMRSELRLHRWVRRRRGVYCSAGTWADAAPDRARVHLLDCAAVLVSLGRPSAVSHASAAVVHSLVLPDVVPTVVALTDPDNWRTGRGYRVSQAQLGASDVTSWAAFSATSVARTLVDCAREWDLVDAVTALDDALHRRLVVPTDLVDVVARQRHWAGIGTAARAVGLADGASESPLESRGRVQIVTSGLPAPELQVELWDAAGFLGRVDGWYEDAAVALEFDGAVKYLDPRGARSPGQVLWEEKRREDRIRATGVRVVRLAHQDLGAGWGASRRRLRDLLASPYLGPRTFQVVRSARRRAG